MRKIIVTLCLATFLFTFMSCREKETTTVIKEVEVEKSEAKEDSEGILERTAKEVDKEINDKIDKEIDKIGDDN
jgi:hypothetical protein